MLMNVVAPHLVRRLPFLFPLYEDGPYRPWFVQTGIVVYSTLARAKLNGLVGAERAKKLVPQLRDTRLRACALYEDAWTNDGRLTLTNIRAAADRGATVLNYAEVVGLDPIEVAADGRTIQVRAKAVVNAAGRGRPVRRLEDPRAKPSMRLSKGVHVVVDGGEHWGAALTIPHDKVRVSFAVPWEGMLLLGTTDTEHDGEPDTVSVSDTDVAQVLAEASVAVDGLGPPRATFVGLRVLPGGEGGTASAKRETVFSTGPSGMVSVAGGKLTTYRRIASMRSISSASAGSRSGPAHSLAPSVSTGSPGRPTSTPRLATISAPLRLAGPRGARPPWRIRRSSSRSYRAAPTCARRTSMRVRTSGRTRRGRLPPPHDRLARRSGIPVSDSEPCHRATPG
jgi:glycerol-3-phosphate dehydrogenase